MTAEATMSAAQQALYDDMNADQQSAFDEWKATTPYLRRTVEPTASTLLARIRSGDWLDSQHFAPLHWAVPGIIPEGFGLMTGAPKAGKSWAALGIGLAVASGGRALGHIDVGDARPVLLLALEDGDRRLQGRCRSLLGADVQIPSRLDYVTTATGGEAHAIITEWLERHGHESPLVILDTLGRVMPPSLPGEGAYQRDYRVGASLKGLVDAHPGACLLVVHHIRKATGVEGDWMDSTSGTNGLNGAADWTVNLHRPRGESAGILRVTGRDVPEGEYAVSCEGGSWVLDGATLDAAAQTLAQQRVTRDLGDRSSEIVAFVSAYGQPVAPKDVEAGTGISDARRYLARLADAGRLRKVGRGLYTPVPTVPSVPMDSFPESLDVSRVGSSDGMGQRDSGDRGLRGRSSS